MKCIFILLYIYAVIDVNAFSTSVNGGDNSTRRKHQDDDRWSWGFVDVNANYYIHWSHKKKTTRPPPEGSPLKESNPCEAAMQQTTMPNFSAQGKRIAEQKCEEYIWAIKKRVKDSERSEACEKYIKETGGTIFRPVAVGGRDALPGEFPHMGAIGWKAVVGTYIFKCGSSLISSKFALTAAHCTKASSWDTEIADPIPKIIRFGDKNIKDDYTLGPSATSNIARIILHPDYKSPKKYNDIALMELDYELWFNKNVQPACLWHRFDTSPLGIRATVTGWGVLKAASNDTSEILQVAQVDVIDSKTCDDLLKPNCNRLWCGIQDTQICAGKLSGGVDACQGDSGGPLQFRIPLPSSVEGAMQYVVGVTSFRYGCALENTPGVYTRAQPYLDWIESIVWPSP